MHPVCRLDGLPDHPAAKDCLSDEGGERRVIGVVVKRVAVGDVLNDKLASAVEYSTVFRLAAAVDAPIGFGEVTSQRVRQQRRRIEHLCLPSDTPWREAEANAPF